MIGFKLPARNLRRHGRRSLYAGTIIAVTLAALGLFDGFSNYMYSTVEELLIYSSTEGHVLISRPAFARSDFSDIEQTLIPAATAADLMAQLAEDPRVVLTAPQLRVAGLMSNGNVSVPFRANGVRYADQRRIFELARGPVRLMVQRELDRPLPPVYGAALGRGLAQILGLDVGKTAMALTSTIDGHINALDVEVSSVFTVPQAELSSLLATLSLEHAQALYDTQAVDRIAVVLRRDVDALVFAGELQARLDAQGLDLLAQDWRTRDPLYESVKRLFDTIFSFMFVIVAVIVGLSVTITVGMSITERTRELGAMRALGLTQLGLVRLIAVESVALATISSAIGGILFVLGGMLVERLNVYWLPPLFLTPLPIRIDGNAAHVAIIGLALIALTGVAGAVAALRAARRSIVDALGYH